MKLRNLLKRSDEENEKKVMMADQSCQNINRQFIRGRRTKGKGKLKQRQERGRGLSKNGKDRENRVWACQHIGLVDKHQRHF